MKITADTAPGYPATLITDLLAEGLLTPAGTVADIGSGTGLLARLFLDVGCTVIGIEPNPEMRAAGDDELRSFANFTSRSGTAEDTMLPAASVDLIIAGQAFHWFDRSKARTEFQRILRPGKHGRWCILIWNDRLTHTTPFLIAYEKLLQDFSTDYTAVDHKQITDDVLQQFFAPNPLRQRLYPNRQIFDFAGLQGRLLSSSYAPAPGHPSHLPMLARLTEIFAAHAHNGVVHFDYQTKVYAGQL